jgi:CRP-like cAMP-binding protein
VAKQFPAGQTGNRLLNLIPTGEFHRLKSVLQRAELSARQVVYEHGSEIEVLYFPTTCVLSTVTIMLDGHAIEVATVGNEGLSGQAAFSTVTTSPHRVFAQIAGKAWRVDAKEFNRELGRLPKLREIITNYQQAFLFQVSQSVACNGLHVLIARCCRWLLMTHDRVDGDEMSLTHEYLSFMLGVRRPGITETLQSLQNRAFIRYTKGKITVVNRSGLEDLACECYLNVRNEYDRMLAPTFSDSVGDIYARQVLPSLCERTSQAN